MLIPRGLLAALFEQFEAIAADDGIRAVVLDGRLLQRPDLDRLLESARGK